MSKPDGRYSLVEADRDVKSDVATVRAFKGGHVGFTVSASFVGGVIAALTAAYVAVHNAKPDAQPQCLTKDEFNESMRVRDEQLRQRLDGIETSVTLLLVRTDRKP